MTWVAEVRSIKRAAGGFIVCAVILCALPAKARSPHTLLACALARNPSLVSYRFNMDVAMRMRHFPWLRFHMAGTGHYARGRTYRVTFTKMPVFAGGYKSIDLSPLDPSLWPHRYKVRLAARDATTMTFLLVPRSVDRRDQNPLTAAYVTLDSRYSTRKADLRYQKGDIQLTDTLQPVGEYRLPASGDVSIDMPGNSLAAHAMFTDYAITRRTRDPQRAFSRWRRPCGNLAALEISSTALNRP